MKKNIKFYLGLAALAFLGAAVLIIGTRLGPGVGGDATIYMTSASNLVKGIGLGIVDASGQFRLLPYFPPFFPLVLAFFAWVGIAPVQTALWMNIILFALTIGLTGLLLYQAGAGRMFAILAAGLVMVSPVLIPAFSWAMAEPPAIWLGLVCIGLVLNYLKSPKRKVLLLGAGIAGGLSILTRYSMAAFLGAAAAGLFLLSREPWRDRLKQAGFLLLTGMLPVLVWIVYDVSQTTSISSRSMENSAGMVARLAGFWPLMRDVLLFWIIPESWISSPPYPSIVNRILIIGLVLAFLLSLGWLVRKGLQNRGEASQQPLFRLAVLSALTILAYIAVVAAVYFTTYPPITIGTRMFSPVQLFAVIFLAALPGIFWNGFPENSKLTILIATGLGILLVWWGWRSARIVVQNSREGMGFNSVSWQDSETIRALKEIPADTPLVTNEEMAIYYLTGRSAYPLAEIYSDRALDSFTRYGEGELTGDEAQKVFREKGASLILFNSISEQLVSIYGSRTDERIQTLTGGLNSIFHGTDGSIFKYPQP